MKYILYFIFMIFVNVILKAQNTNGTVTTPLNIGSIKKLGTSRNAYGNLGVRQMISASSQANAVAIVHRGSTPYASGSILMDVSLDGGTTWSVNRSLIWDNNTSSNSARYPRTVMYNPAGNSVGNNAMLISSFPLLDGSNSGTWGGLGLSAYKLNGTNVGSQSFTSNSSGGDTIHNIPFCITNAGNKVFVLDRSGDNASAYNDKLLMSVGNISGNSVSLSRQILNFATVVGPSGKAPLSDITMAFDATGQTGYMVALTHFDFVSDTNENILPVIMKTTNGGLSWGSPVQLAIANAVNLALGNNLNIVPSLAFEVSASVDQYGICHFLVHVGEKATNYAINGVPLKGGIFHFSTDGNSLLSSRKIGSPATLRGTFGTSTTMTSDTRPCVSKNESGSTLFFSWSETDPNVSSQNNSPDLITVGYDVVTKKYTPAYKFNVGVPVVLAAVSPIVFERTISGGAKEYELPISYLELNATGDIADSSYFNYVKGAIIGSNNFNQFVYNQGNTQFCDGGSTTLTSGFSTGNQWYRNGVSIQGATSSTYPATQSGTYFSVVAGDTSNAITINVLPVPVINLPDTLRSSASSVVLNPGNAQTYLWSTGDTIPTLTVTTTGLYSISIANSSGCVASKNCYVLLGVNPPANTPIQSTSVINYQGIAVDVNQLPIVNSNIGLRFSVLDGTSSGTVLYTETHATTTDASGYFKAYLGGGTATVSSFSSIPWSNGNPKFLKVEMDDQGGTVYRNVGTTQLVSVPYAMHAQTVDELKIGTILRGNNGTSYQLTIGSNGPEWTPISASCGTSVSYSGETYPTVQIGTQCWFSKNLNVGTMVNGNNDQTNNATIEKYCYNNDPANCTIYGGLYQWSEAVQYQNGASNTTSPNPNFSGNVQGICPTGWHIPSNGDWDNLENYLGGASNAGGALKSTSNLWTSPNQGATNSSGFSGIPGGYRETNGLFYSQTNYSYLWSISYSSTANAYYKLLLFDYSSLGTFTNNNKLKGFSVRCLKN